MRQSGELAIKKTQQKEEKILRFISVTVNISSIHSTDILQVYLRQAVKNTLFHAHFMFSHLDCFSVQKNQEQWP